MLGQIVLAYFSDPLKTASRRDFGSRDGLIDMAVKGTEVAEQKTAAPDDSVALNLSTVVKLSRSSSLSLLLGVHSSVLAKLSIGSVIFLNVCPYGDLLQRPVVMHAQLSSIFVILLGFGLYFSPPSISCYPSC
jgi:hypothetical protein